MSARRVARWVGLAWVLTVMLACGPPPAPPSYPGELLPVEALGPDRLLRQHIRGRRGEQEWDMDVVLQKRGDHLLLLALTPFGTRMFAIEQRGAGAVELTSFVEAPVPFPPRFVLLDVHRALFMGIEGPAPVDGRREEERAGERIVERWEGGALRERTFERLDGEPPGVVRIDYGEGMRDGAPPPRIRLQNGWLGYELEIETLSARSL